MATLRHAIWTLLLLLWSATAHAQLPPPGQTAIKPSLVAEGPAPAGGGEVTLAIEMRPDPGWHGYWSNPGEAGVPPRIEWTLPQGASAGALQFPTPEPLMISGIMNYVYEGPYAHLVTLRVPPGLSGTVPVRAKFEWLACTDEVCVPEEGELALDLPVGTGAADAATRARFDRHRAALPVTLDRAGTVAREDDRFRLAVPLPGVDVAGAYFFPAHLWGGGGLGERGDGGDRDGGGENGSDHGRAPDGVLRDAASRLLRTSGLSFHPSHIPQSVRPEEG